MLNQNLLHFEKSQDFCFLGLRPSDHNLLSLGFQAVYSYNAQNMAEGNWHFFHRKRNILRLPNQQYSLQQFKYSMKKQHRRKKKKCSGKYFLPLHSKHTKSKMHISLWYFILFFLSNQSLWKPSLSSLICFPGFPSKINLKVKPSVFSLLANLNAASKFESSPYSDI